jgi:hypothetical protein
MHYRDGSVVSVTLAFGDPLQKMYCPFSHCKCTFLQCRIAVTVLGIGQVPSDKGVHTRKTLLQRLP